MYFSSDFLSCDLADFVSCVFFETQCICVSVCLGVCNVDVCVCNVYVLCVCLYV